MMTKEEVAKQLASITGKPITEFFNGEVSAEIESSYEEPDEEEEIDEDEEEELEEEETEEEEIVRPRMEEPVVISEEVLGYQKMFEGSKVYDGRILNGRQMTKKEYDKFTKGLTEESLYTHPLLFKLFRAEGQGEACFPAFCDKFKKKAK